MPTPQNRLTKFRPHGARLSLVAACTLLAALTLSQVFTPAGSAESNRASDRGEHARPSADYGSLPLRFEANRGQTSPRVKFLARGGGYTLFLAESGAVLRLRAAGGEGEGKRYGTLRLELEGASRPRKIEGLEELSGKSNYLVGADARAWLTGVPAFGRVRYESVYQGIDAVYYGRQGRLEYDLVVAPDADPSRIRLRFGGARSTRVEESGDLVISADGGDVRQQRPVAYQEFDGARREVAARYAVDARGRVRFELGDYDRGRALVIDPVLVYSSYLGGAGDDTGAAVAVDSSGSAYVVGTTTSSDFPGTGSFQATKDAFNDAFVVKLNPDGKSLAYATYLGGNGDDFGSAVAVDAAGNAYVGGLTGSGSFPTTAGAFQTGKEAGSDAFLAKLNPAGTGLVYSTYLGGNGGEQVTSVAVDAAGAAYVAGRTDSPNFTRIPAANRAGSPAYASTDGGASWGASASGLTASVVNDFAVSGSNVYASTNLGVYRSTDGGASWQLGGQARPSTAPPFASAVVVDPTNPSVVYAGTSGAGIYKSTDGGLTFEAKSNGISLPIVNTLAVNPANPSTLYAGTRFGVFKTTNGGESWAEADGGALSSAPNIIKIVIDPSSPQTVYAAAAIRGVFKSTDGGATWAEINTGLTQNSFTLQPRTLALDPSNHSTVYAGLSNFPAGVFKTTNGGASWTSSGAGLTATVNGQTFAPAVNALLVDPASSSIVYAATSGFGVFKSTDGGANWAPANNGLANRAITALASRPGSPAAVLAGASVGADPFVLKLNPAGTAPEYMRMLGGSENDDARGVALGPGGSAYVVGTTASSDFPAVNARQAALAGSTDAYVVKLDANGNTVYSTYLGGASGDQGAGVAVGADGSAYVTGSTSSADFPLANAFKTTLGQNDFNDAFVTKLSPDGQALVYSTYLGGSNSDQALGIAVGADGSAHVIGGTNSADFPLAGTSSANSGLSDAFVAKLNPAGSALTFSTCFGGLDGEQANGVALDAQGGIYIAGTTSSTNLPLTNAARGTFGGGRTDAFVAKFGVEADLSVTVADSRDPVMVGSAMSYTLAVNNAGPSPATGVGLTLTLPASLTYVSAAPTQGSCGVSGQVVTCALGDLAAAGGASVVVSVNPNTPGDATVNASVTGNEPDHTQSNNGDSETTKISASPSIRGRVTAPGGAGLAGVTVTLGGSQSASRQTDADGYYIFEDLTAGGNYTVMPSKENISFEPPSRAFNNLGADQFADFTGTTCAWTLSPPTQSFGAAGGAGSVTVSTLHGCPWTAASNSDWITINSGTSGTDTGTVTFTVAPTTAPRAGRLTIAGQSFAVYQEFNSCGTPEFSVAGYYLPGSSPSLLRSADLNGDGRPDLVFSTGNSGGGLQGSVLLNDGAGGFRASAFDLGLGVPEGFDLGDFNGDGRPDVALTEYSSNFVRILFNNGAGGFPTAANVSFSTHGLSDGAAFRDVKVGDFNGDGKADLAVSTPDAHAVQILLGNGAGGFTQAAPVVNGNALDLLLAAADVNGDGTPDLIYGGGGSNSRPLSVRLGNGAGGFGAPVVSDGTRVTLSVAAADFDGDGKTDLVASTVIPAANSTPTNPTFTNGVTIMKGDGAGHFVVKSSAAAGGLPYVVAADLNKDAKPDVAYSAGGPRVTVHLGDGLGGLGAPLVTDTGAGDTFPGIFGLVAADFDGDTRTDLAGADYSRGADVLRNNCAAEPHISGRVLGGNFGTGLGGVTVTVSGPQTVTTQTDEGGNYFVGGLTAGASYVVTPSKENYRFSPASATVSNLAGGGRADFVATAMTVRLAQMHYVVDENIDNTLRVDVVRGGDTSGPATVNYSTGTTNQTAPASDRSDYTYAAGTLVFAPNETTKSFNVLLNDDRLLEGWEGFTVNLSDPVGALLVAPSSVLVEIRDNEFTQPSTNPIDESTFFVRQHYHDFLNREPDASGLNFWTNEIEKCGADAQCREVKRVNVSAAFFLSIEFQQTGYLVYKTYKAAFNTGEALAQKTFLRDTQQIGLGVVVGAPNWEQALEANKRAYLSAFVQRADFLAAYPLTLTAAQFVDALNANTGGSLTPAERDALVASLGSGAATRAETLRAVAENAEFSRRELNKAFVLTQYYGYLRRGPSESPDTDFSGWQFWLSKLNEFNGNYVQAEMVKAFITSVEYRKRFGPQ